MKKILLSILMLATLSATAQVETGLIAKRATALSRDYLRPSLTIVAINDGSEVARKASRYLFDNKENKFDYNEVNPSIYEFSNVKRHSELSDMIEPLIKRDKIGNQIMKNWFPHYISGSGYDIDVLTKRGEFAATDNDVLKQDASQRKTVLNELGEKLIDRSYIVFFCLSDSSKRDNNGDLHKVAYVTSKLYKLDFNEDVRNDFYNNHYTNFNGIDEMSFPLKHVMSSGSTWTTLKIIHRDPNRKDVEIDKDGGYWAMMDDYSKKVADFQVKVPIVSTKPIAAKIGTKESLKMDRRYTLMEYKQKNNGEQVAKRIATVRSCKVVDNNSVATGHTDELSEFYVIKGSAPEAGMVLVESPDGGLIADVKYGLTGFDISIGYRYSKHFRSKPVGCFAYLNLGLVNSENGGLLKVRGYKLDKDKEGNDLSTGEWKDLSALRLSIGFAKEFNLMRCLVLTPIMEFGFWSPGGDKIILSDDGKNASPAPKDSKEGANGTGFFMSPMVQFGYMVTRNVQIYGETGFNMYSKSAEYKWMRDYYAQENDTDPADPQSVRLGIGARIYF